MSPAAAKYRRRRLTAVLAIALIIGAVAAVLALTSSHADADGRGGATLSAEPAGFTRSEAEIKAELDQRVADGTVTVRVQPSWVIGSLGQKLLVGFENAGDNKLPQRLEIRQDDRVVATTEAIAPGQTLDTIALPDGFHEGTATAVVQVMNGDEVAATPAAVQVSVTRAKQGS